MLFNEKELLYDGEQSNTAFMRNHIFSMEVQLI